MLIEIDKHIFEGCDFTIPQCRKEGKFYSCGGPGAKMCEPIEGQTILIILQIPRFGGSGTKMLQNAGFQDQTIWGSRPEGGTFLQRVRAAR